MIYYTFHQNRTRRWKYTKDTLEFDKLSKATTINGRHNKKNSISILERFTAGRLDRRNSYSARKSVGVHLNQLSLHTAFYGLQAMKLFEGSLDF